MGTIERIALIIPSHIECDRFLAALNCIPQLAVNDAQLRHALALPHR